MFPWITDFNGRKFQPHTTKFSRSAFFRRG